MHSMIFSTSKMDGFSYLLKNLSHGTEQIT